MTGNIDLLYKLVDIEPIPVGLVNGSVMYAMKRGSVALNPNLRLHDVIYMPNLDCNLISITQLLDKIYCRETFTKKHCIV